MAAQDQPRTFSFPLLLFVDSFSPVAARRLRVSSTIPKWTGKEINLILLYNTVFCIWHWWTGVPGVPEVIRHYTKMRILWWIALPRGAGQFDGLNWKHRALVALMRAVSVEPRIHFKVSVIILAGKWRKSVLKGIISTEPKSSTSWIGFSSSLEVVFRPTSAPNMPVS